MDYFYPAIAVSEIYHPYVPLTTFSALQNPTIKNEGLTFTFPPIMFEDAYAWILQNCADSCSQYWIDLVCTFTFLDVASAIEFKLRFM